MRPILLSILARADGSPTTESNMRLMLMVSGIIVGVCLLARIVMVLAQRNQHRNKHLIDSAVIVWGLVTFGSTVLTTVQQWTWEKQHYQDMMAGYADPHEPGPAYPWAIWITLGVIYLSLFFWAQRKTYNVPPHSPPGNS